MPATRVRISLLVGLCLGALLALLARDKTFVTPSGTRISAYRDDVQYFPLEADFPFGKQDDDDDARHPARSRP